MFTTFCRAARVLSGEEVLQLRRVLAAWCFDQDCDLKSDRAEKAARELLVVFQLGVTDSDQLGRLLNDRLSDTRPEEQRLRLKTRVQIDIAPAF